LKDLDMLNLMDLMVKKCYFGLLMNKIFFVTATGTDIGKTFIVEKLCQKLIKKGKKCNSDHYVHHMVYADCESLINYLINILSII
jgi:predicted GTPase